MVNAIVLLNVERGRTKEVAELLVAINGVEEVSTVAGQYDMVAIIKANDDDHFAEIVTEGMLGIEGIRASETLIAIKQYKGGLNS